MVTLNCIFNINWLAYLAKHQCFVPSTFTAKSKQKRHYTETNFIMQYTKTVNTVETWIIQSLLKTYTMIMIGKYFTSQQTNHKHTHSTNQKAYNEHTMPCSNSEQFALLILVNKWNN